MACVRYVELNPVKANTVLADYPRSSYPERIGHSEQKLLDLDSCYQSLGTTHKKRIKRYCEYLGQLVSAEETRLIREDLQRNQLTGNQHFVDEIESRIGLRIEQRGRGRPRDEDK